MDVKTTQAVDTSRPMAPDENTITHEWDAKDVKWFFIYPEQGIATVN